MKKLLLCLLLFFFGLSGVQAKEHWKHGGWGHRHFWYGNRGWYGGGYGGGYWRGGVWIAVQPYSYPYYPVTMDTRTRTTATAEATTVIKEIPPAVFMAV